jgi:MarR family transcriptional regulator, temperature-dependent positive regulator of motility
MSQTPYPGFLARRFQQIAVAVFHAEVAADGFDLTPVQYSALKALRDAPGVDQATLAGSIAFDRTTLGGVVDRLEARGLLNRHTASHDRRARVLEISSAGADLIAHVEPAVQRAQAIMLSGLDKTEAAEFLRLLEKAVEGCNQLSRAPLQSA